MATLHAALPRRANGANKDDRHAQHAVAEGLDRDGTIGGIVSGSHIGESAPVSPTRLRTTSLPTPSTQTTPSARKITSPTRGSSRKSVSGPSALARLARLSDISDFGCDGTSVHRTVHPKCFAKSTSGIAIA